MTKQSKRRYRKRILLTGVFGPYGVDDAFGRKENIMELFHNQVTKGQGLASFRFHHRSFGLYFIAANIDADVTVLDFPSKKRFIKEIKKGYDAVGISFIAPNFVKAREMARLTRRHAGSAEIIMGGHGAAIEDIETLIECDHVVKGEGIRWMRRYLGQDEDAPFVHPALPSTERQEIFGVPVPGPTASLLVPGVGCVNGCSFCSTSHFFGKKYTSFISSGRQLFETAKAIADERGTDAFFIMDENFLKDKTRAMSLIEEMERHNRFFVFHIFSSAEAITAFGIDNLVRLGVQFIWIGLESKTQKGRFDKNKGIDPVRLVKELRDHGISVLASGILCMEHHTPENIQTDIDFMVELDADMVQFMLLTPLPTTGLYKTHKKRGLLRDDIPWEDIHGQKRLNYHHPAFEDDAPEKFLKAAFGQDYDVNGSSIFRIISTNLRGLKSLLSMARLDGCLERRKAQTAARTAEYGIMLAVIQKYAVNEKERQRAAALEQEIVDLLGPMDTKTRLLRKAALVLAAKWRLRNRLLGDMIQPKTIVTHFKGHQNQPRRSPVPVVSLKDCRIMETPLPAAAAFSMER
jgi:radical SAM superfamily enzyme YgiQ (UPF0313 family)